jgi:hypothetical protein
MKLRYFILPALMAVAFSWALINHETEYKEAHHRHPIPQDYSKNPRVRPTGLPQRETDDFGPRS